MLVNTRETKQRSWDKCLQYKAHTYIVPHSHSLIVVIATVREHSYDYFVLMVDNSESKRLYVSSFRACSLQSFQDIQVVYSLAEANRVYPWMQQNISSILQQVFHSTMDITFTDKPCVHTKPTSREARQKQGERFYTMVKKIVQQNTTKSHL
jgi:hypothetical protein